MKTSARPTPHPVWLRILLGILFWTGVGFFFSTQTMLRIAPDGGSWFSAMKNTMPHWYVWGAVSILIALSDRMIAGKHYSATMRVVSHAPLALLWCSVVILLTTLADGAVGNGFPRFSLSWLGTQYHWNILVYAVILGVLVAADYQRQATARAIQSSELEARLAETRLEALKAQLHPHFLFNTLNAISAYMERDPKTARQMMAHLGDLLRYTLDHQDEHEITLAEELDLAQHYISIQKVRFQDQLEFETDIDETTLSVCVPSLVLQPLLENAVQHGVTRRSAPGKIRISGTRAGDDLLLTVTDNGAGLPGTWSTSDWGTGLTNTTERLSKLYGNGERLTVESNSAGGVTASVTIPWRPNGKRASIHS